jgi:hypothetical protein
MIIDTLKLSDAVAKHFAALAEETDKRCGKNDTAAFKALTRQETQQIKEINIIEAVEELATRYMGD